MLNVHCCALKACICVAQVSLPVGNNMGLQHTNLPVWSHAPSCGACHLSNSVPSVNQSVEMLQSIAYLQTVWGGRVGLNQGRASPVPRMSKSLP